MRQAEFAFIAGHNKWHHLCGLTIADEMAAQIYEAQGTACFESFLQGALVGYTSCHMEEDVT